MKTEKALFRWRSKAFLAGFSLFLTAALAAPAGAAGCKSAPLEKTSLVVIGEPVAAVCYRLKVAPEAWVGRKTFWEQGGQMSAAAEFLGCPNSFTGPRLKEGLARIGQIKPDLVLVSMPDCRYKPDLSYEKPLGLLRDAGFSPLIVDFKAGPAPAVQKIAATLDRTADGEKLIQTYETGMQRARGFMANVPAGLRVAVVAGTFQDATGKSFLRLEAAGGYTDEFLLKPMKAVNVAAEITAPDAKVAKGHIALRGMEKVLEARPDAIAVTGDALAVFRAVAVALAKRPDLATVPAAKHFTMYPLPFYAEADPLAYPEVLARWAAALAPAGGK